MKAKYSIAEYKSMLSTKKRSYTQHEANEQEMFFEWAEFQSVKYPDLKWMYAIPNGGSRNKLEAVNLKKGGVRAGVPDICLPCPNGQYHALYIEMKQINGGVTSDEQKAYIEYLDGKGYKAVICNGFEAAKEVILNYLKGVKNDE